MILKWLQRLICFVAVMIAGATHAMPEAVWLVFGANLAGAGPCHPGAPEGADLFFGLLNPETGFVTEIRLIAKGPGPQWLPEFSAKDNSLIYQSGAGTNATQFKLDFSTFNTQRLMCEIDASSSVINLPKTNFLPQLNRDFSSWEPGVAPWSGWVEPAESLRFAILEIFPDFQHNKIGLILPTWVSSNALVATAVNLYPQSDAGQMSLCARLFLLRINNDAFCVLPVRFKGFEKTPFPIQSCSAAAYPMTTPLPEAAPGCFNIDFNDSNLALPVKNISANAPQVYLLVTARPVSADSRKAFDFANNKQSFFNVCSHIEHLANYCASNRIPWVLQADSDFLEGVMSHQIHGQQAGESGIKDGKNIIVEAARLGAVIGPVAGNNPKYNEADAARMIELVGGTPALFASCYRFDPVSSRCEDFAFFTRGLTGLSYTNFCWKPTIMAGAVAPFNKASANFAGIWRPTSSDSFFEHDANGAVVAIGERIIQRDTEIINILDRLRRSELSSNRPYILRFHLLLPDSQVTPDFDEFLAWRFSQILFSRQRGEVDIVTYEQLKLIWEKRYGSCGLVFTP